jgi:chromosome segregation ATPase
MRRASRLATVILGITSATLLAACSAKNGPPPSTTSAEDDLRAEADALRDRLTEVTTALEAAQRERDELMASRNELTAKLEQLERERQAEIDSLQSMSEERAEVSRNRIRNLSGTIETLKKDLEDKVAENAEKDAEIAQLVKSVDTHKSQVASLEQEKTALDEELKATKKRRTTMLAILGGLLAVSAVMTVVGFSKRKGNGDV